MGLAVVVILVSLGMFFLLFFTMKDQTDFVTRFNNEQIAQNTVDALLKTNVLGCSTSGMTMSDIIEDVVVRKQDPCFKTSNETLYEVTGIVLEKTLAERGWDYEFIINDVNGIIYENKTCNHQNINVQTDRPGVQTLRYFPSMVEVNVTLWICV